jgi:hypothetical protein
MPQPHSLRHMPCTRAPHQRILERLLERAMHLITHILNRTPLAHNQCFTKIRRHALPLRIYPDQRKFLPTPIHDILNPEIELAAHYHGVRFAREFVEVRDADGVDFVVDVEAFDILAMIYHDGVDEVVDGGVFVADEDFAVEHFVVFEDVVEHFFVEVLGWRSEVYFHAAGFFGLEVDVAFGGALASTAMAILCGVDWGG